MAQLTCPHCNGTVEITVKGVPKRSDGSSPLRGRALADVLEFMRRTETRKATAGAFHQTYTDLAALHGWPALSKNALGRALVMNGATRWRSGDSRGYTMPEIPADQKPAKPAASVQAKIDRDAYAQALIDHSNDKVVEL